MSILCIGEVLWDLPRDQTETLAGAPLNVAVALKRLGASVVLISGVGADARGRRALQQIHALGLTTEFVTVVDNAQTGVAHIQLDALGNASYSIDRGVAFDFLAIDDVQGRQLGSLHPDWLYYGTLSQTSPRNEQLLCQLKERFSGISCLYDLNLRTQHWDYALVQRLAKSATVLKLNQEEAETLFALDSRGPFSLEQFSRTWSDKFNVSIICITLGSQGCALFSQGALELFPGFPTTVVDTVGAGDAFTAAFLHGLQQKWPLKQIATFSNALGSMIASRATAIPEWSVHDIAKHLKTR